MESPDFTKEKSRKHRIHHSEWLEKALAEGGSRKRRSKKVSNPDFVDTDVALKKSETKDSDAEVGKQSGTEDSSVPDLDYDHMSNYEKFYKYKKEYRAYRLAKIARKKKLSTESSSMDAAVDSPFDPDESNSSVSTKEHENETSVPVENSETGNHSEQPGTSMKPPEKRKHESGVNTEQSASSWDNETEPVSDVSHAQNEDGHEKAENNNDQIEEASSPMITPKEKVEKRGRPRGSRSSGTRQRSSSRQSWDEIYSTPRVSSRLSDAASNSTRPERSRRGQESADITSRQSSRVQKKLADGSAVASPAAADAGDEPMETDVGVMNAIAPLRKAFKYLDKDKYCWFCHKEVTLRESSKDAHRCRTCQKIFHVKCMTEFVIKTEWVVEGSDWECRPCVQYREFKEKDQWAPYVEYLGHDKYKKQLRFIIEKLKKYPSAEELLRPVNMRLFPDYPQYIARPIHFEMIDQRLNDGEYRCVDTLLEDIRWMLHNSIIFNGGSSGITKDLRSLLKNLRMELYDLDSCACCYIHAYTRPELWFVLACPSPHLLVWAQLKGFPYWPAKVYDSRLENRPGEILVKFFGDHARSWIPYEHIYLYSLDPPSECPSKKKKKGKQHNMISSLMEMERHVEFLKKQFHVFKYPEQDILIGCNADERALQLKYMIPLCGAKSGVTKPPTSSPHAKPAPLEPIKLDVTDAKSKRNMLTLLEERLQQSRSDSEDSVKSSGKGRKKTDDKESVVHASEHMDKLRQQEMVETQTTPAGQTRGKQIRVHSNTQRGVRCRHLFEMMKRKLPKGGGKQAKRRKLEKAAENSDKRAEKDGDSENVTNDSGTGDERSTDEARKSGNESEAKKSVKLRLAEMAKKPKCGDIDRFIECHLASCQATTEWDEDRIPPILTPREKRVTRAQVGAIQSQEETTLASQASVELQNEANTKHGKSDDKSEESEIQSKEDDCNTNDNKGAQGDRSNKQRLDQEGDGDTKESKETVVDNETKTKELDGNIDKKPRKELMKSSQLSSLKWKQRLFRHKKFTAQLYQFRKLRHSDPKTLRKKSEDSAVPNVRPDISKFFDVSQAEIKNPVVRLTSINVEEIKALKRTVKMSKTRSKLRAALSSSELDSGIVPIEDTMRISTESEDLTSIDATIDSVLTSEVLSNNYWKDNTSWREDLDSPSTKSSSTPPPAVPWRGSTVPQKVYAFPDNLDLKLRFDSASHTQHVKSIVDYFKTSGNYGASFANDMTKVNLKKLENMAEMLVGLKNQNQISLDTQYNNALNSAELVLYSEYAASYPLAELSTTDYDEEFILD